jgi:hypothetical protein
MNRGCSGCDLRARRLRCISVLTMGAAEHPWRVRVPCVMSASLIGRLGSSTFRLSTAPVSMSLTGSCFSSESAPRPLYGAFVVKEFARQQIFCPSSVLCSISKTVSFARPALRPGRRAVKVGRCTSLAACFAFALTASRATARLRGRDNDQRGARYGRGSIAPQPCIR